MNSALKVQLTPEGLTELQEELQLLQAKEPGAVARVTRAREMGDLSENSEYHAAREDLAFIQGRLEELEDLLGRVEVITNGKSNGQVHLGCTVTVHTQDKKELEFVIVGEYEADPLKKKISADSPLGRALLGKKPKDVVEFEAPIGKVVYTIKHVH